MTWVLLVGVGWLFLGALTAMLIGRSVCMADTRAAADSENFVGDLAAGTGWPTAASHPFPPPAADESNGHIVPVRRKGPD